MRRHFTVTANGTSFAARPGDHILDAALCGGVDIPHHCRSGQCGTCLVHVLDGHVLGGDSGVRGAVHACQAVVLSNLRIAVDAVPPATAVGAMVTGMAALAHDVVEVTLATDEPFAWLPGQYVEARFEGFPVRAFSPTVALDGADRPGTLRFHIKRLAGGRVSGEIGGRIRCGHKVALEGPYGSSYFRPGQPSRLVLFTGGTGFAPLWAIADAALREHASRSIIVVAGVGTIQSLYMAPALERMARCPNVVVLPVAAEPQAITPLVRTGRPVDFASVIARDDVVHAAGPPAMVDSIASTASAAGAQFHADPFTASNAEDGSWLGRAARRLTGVACRFGPRATTGHSASPPLNDDRVGSIAPVLANLREETRA